MSELEPETLTDEQVNSFFESGGEIEQPKEAPQEEVVEESAEEAPEEPASESNEEPEEKPKEEKKVNYGALHEERQRRKEAAERAKAAEERAAELERQLQQFMQRQPTEDEDPLETVAKRQEMVERVLAAQAQQAIKQAEDAKYWQRINESEAAFRQDKPDFDDAVKFLADTRKAELQAIGWSEQDAQKILGDEIRWIADKAYQDEVNPAERFYILAEKRGYKKAGEQPPANNNSAKLDTIARGMQTNKSLPPASKSVKTDLTAEALADMNVDALTNLHGATEFDRAWAKLFGAS